MMAVGYTPQSPQTQANVSKIRPIATEFTACVTALYSSPEAEPIRGHVPFKPRDATAAQLSDPARATDQEIATINLLQPKLEACQKAMADGYSRTIPALAAIVSVQNAAGLGDITLLKERKMTWGEYNSRRRSRSIESEQQIIAELKRAGQ
jgi:hypothetical protein